MVADLRPDRRNTLLGTSAGEQVPILFQVGVLVDVAVNVLLELGGLFFQKVDGTANGLYASSLTTLIEIAKINLI